MVEKLPINVFGGTLSVKSKYKNDSSVISQKPYLGNNLIEGIMEEDTDIKNHYIITNLPDPISIREAALKFFVDDNFKDSSIRKKTMHMLILTKKTR